MIEKYEVVNTVLADLDFIFGLFEHSIRYQEAHGYPAWKNYDKNAIIRDIENRNQFKAIVDTTTAIVFSVAYADKIIWRELDQGDSLYLHRIVVNPELKGQKLFGIIVDWSVKHCQQKGLTNIRMDTWAENLNIINYYKTFGFSVVETFTTPDSAELPVHNRNLSLTLLEFVLDQ